MTPCSKPAPPSISARLPVTDLPSLAARVEALTGPDREVDREIARLQGLRIVDEGHPIGSICYDANGRAMALPAYTRSFDAARTLVPERWQLNLRQMDCLDRWGVDLGHIDLDQEVCATAATPALALTAAALKARAASGDR